MKLSPTSRSLILLVLILSTSQLVRLYNFLLERKARTSEGLNVVASAAVGPSNALAFSSVSSPLGGFSAKVSSGPIFVPNSTFRTRASIGEIVPREASDKTVGSRQPSGVGPSRSTESSGGPSQPMQSARPNITMETSISTTTRFAYVTVVGNKKYVDGAMVLSHSLRNVSNCVANCTALRCCELVVIVPSYFSTALIEMLRLFYDVVVPVEDLSPAIANSVWKFTINKLHMFNLTRYQRAVYFDADCTALKNPDKIFNTSLPNSTYVGAFGGGDYFSTGFMVIIPDADVFRDLLAHFRRGLATRKYGDASTRDGEVIRDFFQLRYVFLPRSYSDYRPSTGTIGDIVVYHFRGGFKPWFSPFTPPAFFVEFFIELGAAYRKWWEHYEAVHTSALIPLQQRLQERWGGTLGLQRLFPPSRGGPANLPNPGSDKRSANASFEVSPLTHYWVMRDTPHEYLRPRPQTLPSLSLSNNGSTGPAIIKLEMPGLTLQNVELPMPGVSALPCFIFANNTCDREDTFSRTHILCVAAAWTFLEEGRCVGKWRGWCLRAPCPRSFGPLFLLFALIFGVLISMLYLIKRSRRRAPAWRWKLNLTYDLCGPIPPTRVTLVQCRKE